MPPSPKPNKVGYTPTTYDWLYLPSKGRKGRTPAMPTLIEWSDDDRTYWRELWRMPQAMAWEALGHEEFVARLVALRAAFRESQSPRVSAEMRQLEDRLGLNPKSMMQLRWRIVADEVQARRQPVDIPGSSARDRLRSVGS